MPSIAGFYGKVPSRGDFVSRRLPSLFIARWDGWLQQGIAASQAALGPAWLDVYLTSPIWRFALAPNVCGDDAYVGVVIPSVDRVGRYFPLAAAASLPRGAPLGAAFQLDGWYSAVEETLLTTLGDAPPDLDSFDERLSRLALPAAALQGAACVTGAPVLRHRVMPRGETIGSALTAPLAAALATQLGYSVWWTQGSDRVAPCVLVSADLPAQQAFVALLDGEWSAHGWISEPRGHVPMGANVATRSGSVTDAGKVRKVNEDSHACRADLGAFIVADGLGGHQSGDVASRMVTSVLNELDGAETVDERAERLLQALRVVNGCLLALSATTGATTVAGSTVAALLIDGATAVCVWAGDSRVYRWRDGELTQLSRDHSEGGPGNRAVTRAVGGVPNLELEIERSEARVGDRYLLCTDGLYGGLALEALAAALALAEPERACEQLKNTVLAGEASDNLTAVVVHVGASTALPQDSP